MVGALRWAEEMERPITVTDLINVPWMMEVEPRVLSHHLWGFLNTNLTGEAYEIFSNVDESMGFAAWRRVLRNISQRTRAELLKLEDKVLAPLQVTKPGEILMALERWELALKTYRDAGGEPLSQKRTQGGVLRLLPEAIRDKVIWDFGDDRTHDEIIE